MQTEIALEHQGATSARCPSKFKSFKLSFNTLFYLLSGWHDYMEAPDTQQV